MNLGSLIDRLSEIDSTAFIRLANGDLIDPEPMSYRGYYDHLAIGHDASEQCTVGHLLGNAKAAVGKVFGGYKGGDFTMSKYTPVWVSNYGAVESLAITHIEIQGRVALIHTANIEDYA